MRENVFGCNIGGSTHAQKFQASFARSRRKKLSAALTELFGENMFVAIEQMEVTGPTKNGVRFLSTLADKERLGVQNGLYFWASYSV